MAENDENRYISISQMVARENIETEKYRVMPRQEAITRLAKCFCQYDRLRRDGRFGCEGCKFAKEGKCEEWIVFNHGGAAEDALDALLSLQSKSTQ